MNELPGTAGVGMQGTCAAIAALGGSVGGNAGVGIIPFKVTKRSKTNTMVTLYGFDGTANALHVFPVNVQRTGVTGLIMHENGGFQFITFSSAGTQAILATDTLAFNWTCDIEL